MLLLDVLLAEVCEARLLSQGFHMVWLVPLCLLLLCLMELNDLLEILNVSLEVDDDPVPSDDFILVLSEQFALL